jgi:hypothetical protein
VISKKNFFIDFLGDVGLFIGKTRFLRKKKSVALPSAICRDFMDAKMKILSDRFLKDAFKLDTSPWG